MPEQPSAPTTERMAQCACGQLSVTVSGDPFIVVACNCAACQRRTGAPFGIGAYFQGAQIVQISGQFRSFLRAAESGRSWRFDFCPDCGSTVYWAMDKQGFKHGIGIAGGCFGDPAFPPPQLITWNQNQAHWLEFPAAIPSMATQPERLEVPPHLRS